MRGMHPVWHAFSITKKNCRSPLPLLAQHIFDSLHIETELSLDLFDPYDSIGEGRNVVSGGRHLLTLLVRRRELRLKDLYYLDI